MRDRREGGYVLMSTEVSMTYFIARYGIHERRPE